MLQASLQTFLMQHRQAAGVAAGLLAVGVGVWLGVRRRRPSAEAVEQARRDRLARVGRLTDGTLVDTSTLDGLAGAGDGVWPPRRLIFRYGVAGVRYEAVQDVSGLMEEVRGLRVDLPVQVRYDHQNPADSIVVAEGWSGLRVERGTGTIRV